MSEAESLRKEIQYLAALIEKHKQTGHSSSAKTHGSKYTWSNRTGLQHGQTIQRGANRALNRNASNSLTRGRKRCYQESPNALHSTKIVRTTAPPPATTAGVKAGVSFNPKYKWSKDSSTESSLTVSKTSSLQNATQNKAAAVSLNPSSSTASNVRQFPQAQKVNPQMKLPYKSSRYKYLKRPSDGGMFNNNIKTQELDPSGLRFRRNAFEKKPSKFSQKWQSKRPNLKYKPQKFPAKWPSKTLKKNPYKLNRVTKSFPATSVSKKQTMHRPVRTQRRRSLKTSKAMDRRQQAKETSSHITLSRTALESLLQKHSMTLKQVLASRAVAKSHETTRLRRQEKKRQHCLYYGRFGKCMRGDSCKFIHDPTRIAVCTRFLRGTCRDENCSFSHKVEKEKIPLCLFFLRGKCSVPNCPYVHVFLGKDASVCRRFSSTGYCPDADKCKMQHIKCCPEFYETGRCSRGKACELPHFRINKFRVKKETSKESQNKSDETGTSKPQTEPAINIDDQPSTSSPSSCPDFLSLDVASPEPLNKPVRKETALIKPRFGKLKSKISSSQ